MILDKYNWKTKMYECYIVPNTWNVKLYSENMEEIVNCPHCGIEFKYGEGYTSREIHTGMGMGYSVCESCYTKERKREFEGE